MPTDTTSSCRFSCNFWLIVAQWLSKSNKSACKLRASWALRISCLLRLWFISLTLSLNIFKCMVRLFSIGQSQLFLHVCFVGVRASKFITVQCDELGTVTFNPTVVEFNNVVASTVITLALAGFGIYWKLMFDIPHGVPCSVADRISIDFLFLCLWLFFLRHNYY